MIRVSRSAKTQKCLGVREDNSRLVFQEETVESMEPFVLLGFQMDRTPSWNCPISPEENLMEGKLSFRNRSLVEP